MQIGLHLQTMVIFIFDRETWSTTLDLERRLGPALWVSAWPYDIDISYSYIINISLSSSPRLAPPPPLIPVSHASQHGQVFLPQQRLSHPHHLLLLCLHQVPPSLGRHPNSTSGAPFFFLDTKAVLMGRIQSTVSDGDFFLALLTPSNSPRLA
jgi:hypothetical protein